MERWHGFENWQADGRCMLSIGNFDGVHSGHQTILKSLVAQAQAFSIPAVVLTFEPHPMALLRPQFLPPRLTTADQKAKLLEKLGVDKLIEYPTDRELLQLSPQEFFDRIIVSKLNTQGLVEGPNFFFGQNRSGNVQILEQFCNETGRTLTVIPLAERNAEQVSSSQIRQALSQGQMDRAEAMLGRRYSISGVVSLGAQRGRTIGFPTANLEQIQTLLPADGVYAAWAKTDSGEFPAAVNIGPNPTFSEMKSKVEAHLLGYAGDLYGQILELEFITRLRNLRPFGTVTELQTQITKDVAQVSELCKA
ncbi:bifunctional riboflavin kinase/FAD synthetase [Planctomicrobium sp. SH527]|uniref:bifunctional riboflavin kinase/FAD synthetase n=1 Tax=Planctomicrobium sp. SH527 TaxID=3448123 RepID=UPI003F5AEBD2